MNFRFARTLLAQVSFPEKLLVVCDILLVKLQEVIPAEYRDLRLFLRDLLHNGAEIRKIGGSNLITADGGNGLKYRFLVRRRTSDEIVARQVLFRGEYESLIQMISRLEGLASIKSIVDAGANVGFATIYLLGHCPAATCYSIEPEAKNFEALLENIRVNDFQNVFPIKAALWGVNEYVGLSRDFRDGADWSVQARRQEGSDGQGLVRGVTLHQLIEELCLPQVDVLKVDIEGAEAEVFSTRAAPEKFLSKVKFLAMEIHEEMGRKEEILNMLAENGFEMNLVRQTYIGFNRRFFPRG
jgi:FkbM family methyltransferase